MQNAVETGFGTRHYRGAFSSEPESARELRYPSNHFDKPPRDPLLPRPPLHPGHDIQMLGNQSYAEELGGHIGAFELWRNLAEPRRHTFNPVIERSTRAMILIDKYQSLQE